jgi:hypothetical protein
MRVRMRVGMTGSRGGADWPRVGQILEVGDDEGSELLRAGIAGPLGTTEEDEVGPTVDDASGRAVETDTGPFLGRPAADDTDPDADPSAPAPVTAKAKSEPEPEPDTGSGSEQPRPKPTRRGGPANEPGGN